MLANPEEAGKLVETELPQLGLKAAVMTARSRASPGSSPPPRMPGRAWRRSIRPLSELSPEVIGGKLPDDGFYFNYTP